MAHSVFRDDGGRKYQATNDEYSLPADEAELERLEVQHRAFKTMQGGKNYWAPIDQALQPGADASQEMRVLDVGTGNGGWAIETAIEFPHVQVYGIDLSPVQYGHQTHVPDNCQFALEDASKGLPYSDGYFDVVHMRILAAGIRDWSALVNEVVRVLKSGGLMVFVEIREVFRLADDQIDNMTDTLEPGFVAFANYVDKALELRGLQPHAGRDVIPDLIKAHEHTRDLVEKPMHVPLAPWSDDPLWNQVGKIMIPDTQAIPDTLHVLIADACKLSDADFEALKAGYMKDLFEDSVHGIIALGHIWAFKV